MLKNLTKALCTVSLILLIISACESPDAATTPTTAPEAPSGVTATRLSDTSCRVVWTDNSYCEDEFIIEYSLSSTFSPSSTTSTAENEVSLDLTGLNSNATYYVRVYASNSTGASDYSASAEIDLSADPSVLPAAPSDPVLTSVIAWGSAETSGTTTALLNPFIHFSWTDNSNNEEGFFIQRSEFADFSTTVTTFTTAAGETSYTDTDNTISGDSHYYYRVRANNSAGYSSYSNIVELDLSTAPKITINFTDGTEWGERGATDGETGSIHGDKIYTVWMEDGSDFFSNIYICNHVNTQDLTGTLLPFWETNRRGSTVQDIDEIDAVSGATQKTGDFAIDIYLDGSPEVFDVYFEIDHSFDENDWFTSDSRNQPALLYKIADIDLTSSSGSTFPSNCIGWTPDEYTNSYDLGENKIPGMNVNIGNLQSELGYITQHAVTPSTPDTIDWSNPEEYPATDLVAGLQVTLH